MRLADRDARHLACDAAFRALRLCKEAGYLVDERSEEAVRVAKRFADGEATRDEMNVARAAAWAAADASAPAATYTAACAAAWSAATIAEGAGKHAPALAEQAVAYLNRKVSA